jgi:uncharacterized repeat protein (TIGR03847 family)
MSVFYEFDEVDAFTVGVLGEPGHRVFLLQCRRGSTRVAVKCEKQQAAAIAAYLRKVLHDLPQPDDRPLPASLELVPPLEPAFVLGPVGLGYDRENDRLLVQLEEIVVSDVEDDDDDQDEAARREDAENEDVSRGHVRLFLTRGQAVAFCERSEETVAAGRPLCIFCGLPINPDGHPCPRMN